MKIILKEDIAKLGKAGDSLEVQDGFARNFLLPKKLALAATADNLKVVEQEKQKKLLRQEKEKKQAQDLAQKIASTSCTITVKSGPDGKLFGSITNQDIAQAYQAEGIELDKKKIELAEPIKEVGVFKLNIKLHPEVVAEAKIWVVKE